MKYILLALMFIGFEAHAQTESKFHKAMVKGLDQLKHSKTTEDFVNTANVFERIASAEAKEWLPLYYQAFALIMSANEVTDLAKKDQIYDKAGELAEKANLLSKDNSEIVTLQSWITSMKIAIDPMTRGQKLGMEASMLTAKAIQLNPDNPRPYFLQGTGLLFTPEQFGGGKDKALPVLEKALDKYNTFKPANDLMPDWGKERALMMLEECKK
jgi:hypothetical protein